jgi:hypothetical protein
MANVLGGLYMTSRYKKIGPFPRPDIQGMFFIVPFLYHISIKAGLMRVLFLADKNYDWMLAHMLE